MHSIEFVNISELEVQVHNKVRVNFEEFAVGRAEERRDV